MVSSRPETFHVGSTLTVPAADVKDLYTTNDGSVLPAFTHVAANLPEVFQYLDLVRDAGSAFGLPALPDNVVEHFNPYVPEYYVGKDIQRQKNAVPSKEYDEAADEVRRGKKKLYRQAALRRKREKEAVAKREVSDKDADGNDEEAVVVGSLDQPVLLAEDEEQMPDAIGVDDLLRSAPEGGSEVELDTIDGEVSKPTARLGIAELLEASVMQYEGALGMDGVA